MGASIWHRKQYLYNDFGSVLYQLIYLFMPDLILNSKVALTHVDQSADPSWVRACRSGLAGGTESAKVSNVERVVLRKCAFIFERRSCNRPWRCFLPFPECSQNRANTLPAFHKTVGK